MEEFNFVIAKRWWDLNSSRPLNTHLNIYSYGSEVHYGTQKNAEDLLNYIQTKTNNYNYKIYKINV